MITYDEIKAAYLKRGHLFLDSGNYVPNLFGIRSKDPLVNEFNDILGVAYLDGYGQKQCLTFAGTTKPGLYWLKKKLGNINGTFILAPGQYAKCWHIAYHHVGKPNQYLAYVQRAPGVFSGWRDNDSDGQLDMNGPLFSDVAGLNGHTTSAINQVDDVEAYSAGCQVVQDDKEHGIWLNVGRRAAELHENAFTYTLFQQQ